MSRVNNLPTRSSSRSKSRSRSRSGMTRLRSGSHDSSEQRSAASRKRSTASRKYITSRSRSRSKRPKPSEDLRSASRSASRATTRLGSSSSSRSGSRATAVVVNPEITSESKEVAVLWDRLENMKHLQGILQAVVMSKGDKVFLLFNDGTHDFTCTSYNCSEDPSKPVDTVSTVAEIMANIFKIDKPLREKQRCIDIFLELPLAPSPYTFPGCDQKSQNTSSTPNVNEASIALAKQHSNVRVHLGDRRQFALQGEECDTPSIYFTITRLMYLLGASYDTYFLSPPTTTKKQLAALYKAQATKIIDFYGTCLWESLIDQIELFLVTKPLFAKIAKQGPLAATLIEEEIKTMRQDLITGEKKLNAAKFDHKKLLNIFTASRTFVHNGSPVPRYIIEPQRLVRLWLKVASEKPSDATLLMAMIMWTNWLLQYVGTLFTDVYTFGRVMKTFNVAEEGRKCRDSSAVHFAIMPAGEVHIERYQEWLLKAGFKIQFNLTAKGVQLPILAQPIAPTQRCLDFRPIAKWLKQHCAIGAHCFG